ncbi:MAG: hypothetical protein FWC50_00145 [Planctomycetaceae bacterium]|nr:hypothetical protein [Planctomycetaceae bacterium]
MIKKENAAIDNQSIFPVFRTNFQSFLIFLKRISRNNLAVELARRFFKGDRGQLSGDRSAGITPDTQQGTGY